MDIRLPDMLSNRKVATNCKPAAKIMDDILETPRINIYGKGDKNPQDLNKEGKCESCLKERIEDFKHTI